MAQLTVSCYSGSRVGCSKSSGRAALLPLQPGVAAYGVGDGLVIAGCGVGVDEGIQPPKPVATCCRAAVLTPLRIARPIAA